MLYLWSVDSRDGTCTGERHGSLVFFFSPTV